MTTFTLASETLVLCSERSSRLCLFGFSHSRHSRLNSGWAGDHRLVAGSPPATAPVAQLPGRDTEAGGVSGGAGGGGREMGVGVRDMAQGQAGEAALSVSIRVA
jgi:hypothetical protein